MVGLLQYVAGAATGTEAVKLLGYGLATETTNSITFFVSFHHRYHMHRGEVKILVPTPFFGFTLFASNVWTALTDSPVAVSYEHMKPGQ